MSQITGHDIDTSNVVPIQVTSPILNLLVYLQLYAKKMLVVELLIDWAAPPLMAAADGASECRDGAGPERSGSDRKWKLPFLTADPLLNVVFAKYWAIIDVTAF